jgi:hypothetical protein
MTNPENNNSDSKNKESDIAKNLNLANEVAHTNLKQQNEINNQQALFQLKYASVAKCIEIIMSIDPDSDAAQQKIKTYRELMDQFVDIFGKMELSKSETQPAVPQPQEPSPTEEPTPTTS